MLVLRHYQDVPATAKGAVVAIGNFDGIHRGHQEIIAKAGRLAKEFNAPHGVMTFEPHPRSVFRPDDEPFRLTPFRIKARLIEALGVDQLCVMTFDHDFAGLSPEAFAGEVLAEGLGVRYVVVGDNFRFGHKAKGTIDDLERLGRANGFGVTSVDRIVSPHAEAYSSTHVRDYLQAGNPTRAALLLGRYWEIEGRIQAGDKRGRDLGFPTANMALGETLRPAFGVYAVRAAIDRGAEPQWHAGVANLGIRPMFESPEPLLEVNLFDFDQDIYGQHLRVALVDYLRPEMKFDGLAALKTQMAEDKRRAEVTLALEEWDASWPASPFMAATMDPSDWSR
jgi:riboflavin kinase/FMN adenylyltransferase